MRAIILNIYGNPSGTTLDPDASIEILKRYFPDADIHAGDQLALRALRAEEHGSPEQIVRKLWMDARTTGPAYAFSIPPGEGAGPVKGVIKRHLANVLFEDDLPSDMREKMISFLRELVPDGVSTQMYEVTEGNKRTPIE